MATKKITLLAVFSALSIIFLFSFRAPIFPIAPFLMFDFADIPIIFATITLGASSGLIITFIVCVLQGIFMSADGIIGIIMHLVATGSFVLVFGLINKKVSDKRLIIGDVCGVFAWVISMILFNIVFTPLFMKAPISRVMGIMLPAIIPFNIIKSVANSTIAIILYKILMKIKPINRQVSLLRTPKTKKVAKTENNINKENKDSDDNFFNI